MGWLSVVFLPTYLMRAILDGAKASQYLFSSNIFTLYNIFLRTVVDILPIKPYGKTRIYYKT